MELLNLKGFVFLLLSLIINTTRGDNHNHEQLRANMLKDFRPSRLISETRQETDPALLTSGTNLNPNLSPNSDTNKNVINRQVAQSSPGIPSDIEPKTESSIIQGRVFGGGGGFGNGYSTGSWGSGGNHCQNLHSYNPGCCNLGFKNCCHGGSGIGIGGGIQFPPLRHPPGNSWSSWKVKPQPQPHYPPIQHQHNIQHHHHPQPHFNQGWFKPRPRPHVQPFPIANNYQKPGSCYYSAPSLSIFDKFSNFFTKGKVLDVHNHHNQKGFNKGWGWNPYPPSQNAGYHFHRRSDTVLSKRQLDLSTRDENSKQYNEEGFYNNYNNNYYNKDTNNIYADPKPNIPIVNEGAYDNQDHFNAINSNGNNHNNNRQDKKYEASYPTQSFSPVPHNVGIGSLTGRIFGGFGWNSGITTGWTVADHNIPCFTDYECPGHRKCCSGACKTPSFSG